MNWWLAISLVYLLVGITVTAWTRDPEQDGWLWMILFWPLQILARF